MWKNKISSKLFHISLNTLRYSYYEFLHFPLKMYVCGFLFISLKKTPTSLFGLNCQNMTTCHKKGSFRWGYFLWKSLVQYWKISRKSEFLLQFIFQKINKCRSLSIWKVKSRLKLIEPFIRWYNVCPEVHFSLRRVHVHVF